VAIFIQAVITSSVKGLFGGTRSVMGRLGTGVSVVEIGSSLP
jgi:hypothetical protein